MNHNYEVRPRDSQWWLVRTYTRRIYGGKSRVSWQKPFATREEAEAYMAGLLAMIRSQLADAKARIAKREDRP